MELVNIAVGKIKPDKNQPRQHFDKEMLQRMAASMKEDGVIVPIEIDQKNVIICGEQRWRAAKMAGLKEIPCIVNTENLSTQDRLMRQCKENTQRKEMSTVDTALAFKRLLKGFPGGHKRTDKGYLWLAQQLGLTRSTVTDHINLLNEPKWVQDNIDQISVSLLREINYLPPKTAEKIKRKFIKNEITNKVDFRLALQALKKHPEREDDILACFDTSGVRQELAVVGEVLPRVRAKKWHPDQLANKADMYVFRLERDLETIIEALSGASKEHKMKFAEGLIRLHGKMGSVIKGNKLKQLL